MPDKKNKAKAQKWFSKKCWIEMFRDYICEDPDGSERIMVMMISLHRMIKGNKTERNTAARAIQNCVKACALFTRTQFLAECGSGKPRSKRRKAAVRLRAEASVSIRSLSVRSLSFLTTIGWDIMNFVLYWPPVP